MDGVGRRGFAALDYLGDYLQQLGLDGRGVGGLAEVGEEFGEELGDDGGELFRGVSEDEAVGDALEGLQFGGGVGVWRRGVCDKRSE